MRLEINRHQIEDLESATNQAYKYLKRAVNTKDHRYAVLARLLYSDDLGRLLSIAVDNAPFMYQSKRTRKAKLLGKYMLQYALGDGPSVILESSLSHKERYGEDILLFPTRLSENNLISAINNQEIRYARIQDMAIGLAHAGKFEIIVNALDYVRRRYQKPIV